MAGTFDKVFKLARKTSQASYTLNEKDFSTQASIIETWSVIVDDHRNFDEIDICGCPGLPQVNMVRKSIKFGTTMICKRVQPVHSLALSNAWDVEVEWFVPQFTFTPGTLANIHLSVGGQDWQQATAIDRLGQSIVNSVGDSFDPQRMREYSDEQITIEYDSDSGTIPFDDMTAARKLVNDGTISITHKGFSRTYAARQLRLDDAEWTTTFNGADSLWHVKIVMGSRLGTQVVNLDEGSTTVNNDFTDYILDQGFYQKVPMSALSNTIKKVRILDSEGNPTVMPSLLDGEGNAIDTPTTSAAVYVPYEIEAEFDFTTFLFGIS